MRKLLLAAGDRQLSPTALDFGCYLARLTKSNLVGVFLETPKHEESPVVSMQAVPYAGLGEDGDDVSERKIDAFSEACLSRSVAGVVHGNGHMPWRGLLAETRFADALIMDADFTMQAQVLEAYPSRYAKKLLNEAECPVIISPLSFERIDEIIFTYDGSKSSAHAIRQFIYLFPELKDTKSTILEIASEEETTNRSDQPRLKEWLKHHFTNVDSVTLEGDVQSRLLEFLLSHSNAFVVMGGFGRSRASRILQPSTSGAVVKLVSSPVFVAHF